MGKFGIIPETFNKIIKSNTIEVPSANHYRDFSYIDDVVEFTIRACQNQKTNREILNIGNPSAEIKIKDLVLKIAKLAKKKINIIELLPVPGSVARRPPDISKIEKFTHYKHKVTLDEGLLKTYYWYKKNYE